MANSAFKFPGGFTSNFGIKRFPEYVQGRGNCCNIRQSTFAFISTADEVILTGDARQRNTISGDPLHYGNGSRLPFATNLSTEVPVKTYCSIVNTLVLTESGNVYGLGDN